MIYLKIYHTYMHLFHICTEYIQKIVFSDEKLKWGLFCEKRKGSSFDFFISYLKFKMQIGDGWDGQSIVSSDEKLKWETFWEKEKDHPPLSSWLFYCRCLENWHIWSVKNVESETLLTLLKFLTHWQFCDPPFLPLQLYWLGRL